MNKIISSLMAKKLATGGQLIESPAKFLRKGDIVEMDLHNYYIFHIELPGKIVG